MKTFLVITLMFAGQPPWQTYMTVFDNEADCHRAIGAFRHAYSAAYGVLPDRSRLSVLQPAHPHVIRADCVSGADDLLHSN
jgi:hypothetical protein